MARSANNLKAVFQDTATAIKNKTGSTEPICPRDFADEIDNLPTGGGDEEFVEYIEGTATSITNNDVTKIAALKFFSDNNIVSVNFPTNSSVLIAKSFESVTKKQDALGSCSA